MFPNKFEDINIKDRGHVFKEADDPEDVWIYHLPHYEYDPHGIINNDYEEISYVKITTH